MAENHGCLVSMSNGRVPAFHPGNEDVGPSIFIPKTAGILEQFWMLAHELGHLLNHRGYINAMSRDRQESQAERWAACALIPFDRIAAYSNACEDAMIAALSAHYEDLPYEDCPARELAGKIARIRLESLAQEVA
jgi:Zn-dependent peptidase ImmA (M78 family)